VSVAELPVVDLKKTGENIRRLRTERGLRVRDVQEAMGLGSRQAIYHWEQGRALPSVDNLCILSAVLGVSIDDILVRRLPGG